MDRKRIKNKLFMCSRQKGSIILTLTELLKLTESPLSSLAVLALL